MMMDNVIASPVLSSPRMQRFVVGGLAGGAAALITAPLDLVKTVSQNRVGARVSTAQVLKVALSERGVKGCFRGIGPTLFGIVPTTSIYFGVYENTRRLLGKKYETSPLVTSVVSSMTAGVTAQALTNPLWVVKTRMQTEAGNLSFRTLAGMIYRAEGCKGFMRGISASVAGASQYAVQFPVYEAGRDYLTKMHKDGDDAKLSLQDVVFASCGSRVTASVITYPQQVLRTRLQTGRGAICGGLLKTAFMIMRQEGVRALYNGMCASLMKSVPTSVITLCCFEFVSRPSIAMR